MNKLRIMRVITWLPLGGIERRLVQTLERLNRDKYQLSVSCIKKRGSLAQEVEALGIPLFLQKVERRWSPRGLWGLAQLFKREQVDIVHAHMYRANTSATVAARLAGVPVVVTHVHSMDTWQTRRQLWMDKKLHPWRDRVIAVSEAVRQNYLEKTHVAPEKVITLYNGIDLEEYKIDAVEAEAKRRELGLLPEHRVVAVVARLVEAKALHFMLEAAAQVVEAVPTVRFLMVGDGPLEAELKAQTERLNLNSHVIFTGRRQDVPQIYAASQAAALSSVREGFSNVVVEAMTAGLPVVATDVGGNREAVIDGHNGFIVPSRQPQVLAQGLIKLLSDQTLAEAMGRSGRQRAQELFSLEKMVEKTEALYDTLAEEKKLM